MKTKTSKAILERKKNLKAIVRKERNLRKVADRFSREDFRDGRAVIDVDLSDSPLYTPLSYGKQKQLSADIFEHIEQCANLLPYLVPLKVVFHNGLSRAEEQDDIRHQYRHHYSLVMQDGLWDQRQNTQRMIYMILIGVAFLTLYLFLALNREDDLFLELLSVIGSFSLWEAANCFLVERRNIRGKLMDTAQFMDAMIEFTDDVKSVER